MDFEIHQGDCREMLSTFPARSFQLVVGSPPYEDVREYGDLQFDLTGQDWVDWAVPRFKECLRVCEGLVVWVVQGKTKDFRWSCTPALLMADLHRAGVNLRNPAIFHRVSISGSGGPDWLRSDYEWIICASQPGRLPWSDNTAMGEAPKFPPGGAMSHQSRDGRVNRPRSAERRPNGTRDVREYKPPERANPGNVIHCSVGGGKMGSKLAHEHPAPFPERLVEFFVKSFCPPGGTVLDPYCGSGTTGVVALRLDRKFVGIDLNPKYVEMAERRIRNPEPVKAVPDVPDQMKLFEDA